ncbi:MAG: holo-[acyl-carrier-protein] synthase, partial [Desulfuromonadaceae bacterium]|nr:holo-[acyl-carrier-protein] synthase [Desulfuromonadaceae bacterium]
MIYGIGTDIIATSRFQRFLDEGNRAILDRLFSRQELETCGKRKDAASCLAARFAAKEAFMKALGTGLRGGITWHDVEVANDLLGKPELILSGRIDELFKERGLNTPLLSLSHDGGHAVALVVLETL